MREIRTSHKRLGTDLLELQAATADKSEMGFNVQDHAICSNFIQAVLYHIDDLRIAF